MEAVKGIQTTDHRAMPEPARVERVCMEKAATLGVTVQIDLKPAIQEESIDHICLYPSTDPVRCLKDQRGDSPPLERHGACQPGEPRTDNNDGVMTHKRNALCSFGGMVTIRCKKQANMSLIHSFRKFFMVLLLFGVVLLSAMSLAQAQQQKPFAAPRAELQSGAGVVPPEILKSVDSFFTTLKQDKVPQAFDEILANTRVKDRVSEVNDMKAKTSTLLLEFGKVLDYELVNVKKVGSRIFVLTFLSYSDAYPIRWNMTFYKPTNVWRLIDIRGEVTIRDLGEDFGESTPR